jgi:hypothetical protein
MIMAELEGRYSSFDKINSSKLMHISSVRFLILGISIGNKGISRFEFGKTDLTCTTLIYA